MLNHVPPSNFLDDPLSVEAGYEPDWIRDEVIAFSHLEKAQADLIQHLLEFAAVYEDTLEDRELALTLECALAEITSFFN